MALAAPREFACPALVLLDLNGFKEINDRFEDPAGDQVLVNVSQWLVAAAPDGATLARLRR